MITNKTQSKKNKKPAKGADDFAVLNPERSAVIAGREITCREYAFVEELELRHITQPIIDGLQGMIEATGINDRDIELLVSKNMASAITLITISAGVTEEFVRGLNQADGKNLFVLWWSVVGPFFLRCAIDNAKQTIYQKMLLTPAGQTSTQPSSPTATASDESGTTATAS